jgi:hypothetical protein
MIRTTAHREQVIRSGGILTESCCKWPVSDSIAYTRLWIPHGVLVSIPGKHDISRVPLMLHEHEYLIL